MALIALSVGLASFHHPKEYHSKPKPPLEEPYYAKEQKRPTAVKQTKVTARIEKKDMAKSPISEVQETIEVKPDPTQVVKNTGCVIEALSSRLDVDQDNPIRHLDIQWVVENYEGEDGNRCQKLTDILAQIKQNPSSTYSYEALKLLLDNYDMLYAYLGRELFEKEDSPLIIALKIVQQNPEYNGLVKEFLGKHFEEPGRYIPNQFVMLLKAEFAKKDPGTKILLATMMDELPLDESFRLQWDENGCEASFLENEDSGICLNLLSQNEG